jgi:hypothetical protein
VQHQWTDLRAGNAQCAESRTHGQLTRGGSSRGRSGGVSGDSAGLNSTVTWSVGKTKTPCATAAPRMISKKASRRMAPGKKGRRPFVNLYNNKRSRVYSSEGEDEGQEKARIDRPVISPRRLLPHSVRLVLRRIGWQLPRISDQRETCRLGQEAFDFSSGSANGGSSPKGRRSSPPSADSLPNHQKSTGRDDSGEDRAPSTLLGGK